MSDDLHLQVKNILADIFQVPVEDLSDDLTFGDIPQWDSMGHMDVIMSLEENFGIQVTAETIVGLTSLPAIYGYLEQNGHD